MTVRSRLLVGACWLLSATVGRAQAPTAAQRDFFEAKVRPVLVQHCYECHSGETKKQKGGLRLDHRDGLRKGGDSGAALVPGKPAESLIIKAVRQTSAELKMPPKGKLPASVIADLEEWVKMGAPDPRDQAMPTKTAATWDEMLRTRRDWWSLQPVRKGDVPKVKNAAWSEHPVDRFLLAKLEQAGLSPAPAADARTLIRRLHLVLTGLPPTATELDAFLRDGASAKPQAAVERLLRSPHFGERWARHWMDVVRFSETHGNEWNYDVHHAWRYRDYLIRAFNDDVPYDQLIREHIAGDLLPSPRWNQKERFNESVIGTAFFRFGEVNHDDCIGLPTLGYDILDNQIDTLSKAFQASTVACARCHDHKIDAVSMKDYYALLGILRSARAVSHTIDAPDVNEEQIQRLQTIKTTLRPRLARLWLKDLHGLDAGRLGGLKIDKTTWDQPLHLWRSLEKQANVSVEWAKLAKQFDEEARARTAFNSEHFVSFGDFRDGRLEEWRADGHGLRQGPGAAGDFTVRHDGEQVIGAILPEGLFTHAVSEKLNGTLRSPVLPTNRKRISFQVIGGKQAAVRIVSNHCQLNYRNFRALKSGEWHWITLEIPEEAGALRSYAELMTKFDNPKYPDQLGQLGGDDTNQRVPWDQAAADPYSYFGITRAVLHDVGQPPKDELTWLEPLYAGAAPQDLTALAARYRDRARRAIQAWADGRASAEDVRWLDWLLRQGLLSNSVKSQPTLDKLAQDYRDTERRLALPRIVPGLGDFDAGIDQPVLLRGDCKKPGELVARRYLEVLSPPHRTFVPQGSGRRALADTIADPANPLTARVMVNRVWHHVFGYGMVRTTDDFGRMGDVPSHPELLDWLAQRFVEDGWSVKKLVRLLVTSQAFQMASRAEAHATEIDLLNRLLHHYPARRLEAEAIRDSILATSGRLDRTLYGLSVLPYREKANEDRRLFPGPLDGRGRRSLYIKVNLMEGPRFLSAFDLPGGKVSQGRRDVTNVPAQALALLNDPFVLQQAEHWAKNLVQRPSESAAARVDHMFQTALGRPPLNDERERFVRFVAQLADVHQVSVAAVTGSMPVWQDVAHALFNVQEFIYIP
jgi:hypothetical protein